MDVLEYLQMVLEEPPNKEQIKRKLDMLCRIVDLAEDLVDYARWQKDYPTAYPPLSAEDGILVEKDIFERLTWVIQEYTESK